METVVENYKPDMFDRAASAIGSKMQQIRLMHDKHKLQSKLSDIVDQANDINNKGKARKGDVAYQQLWNKARMEINSYAELHGVDAEAILDQSLSIRQLRDLAEYDQTEDVKNKLKFGVIGVVTIPVAVGMLCGLVSVGYHIITHSAHYIFHL